MIRPNRLWWYIVLALALVGGSSGPAFAAPLGGSPWAAAAATLRHGWQSPLALLLVQLATILLMAKLLGALCRKIGQPAVVGEMAAGIVLGPSLVGRYFPTVSAHLFPPQSLETLRQLSQIGLILFMFVVGLDLDWRAIRGKVGQAVVISHASILLPFGLGFGLAYFLYGAFAPVGVAFSSFGLFLGTAMSITAFPVLARIVRERGLHTTALGALVLTCAAVDDVTAWCLLAAVVALVRSASAGSALGLLALAAVYVGLMLRVVRPLLVRLATRSSAATGPKETMLPVYFLLLVLSAFAAELIGIHALFGAFLAGAIVPGESGLREWLSNKVRAVAEGLLLPLFFVFTGLRTEISLLNTGYLWGICALIVAVAVAGKLLGSALAARFVGHSWSDSLRIGTLMNTRGLMEIVVLNIGYDLGILTPQVFAMMVIMALATTCMTGPALNLIERHSSRRPSAA
ncbi:cation:proton antiporter [Hymenobacter rubidus]|uniref:cation:proton antiporter n=1 Tax=Hymenobacter rubidus TaxID=1441626 RepID=UPI00191C9FDF|nr:cation:proton antiporter [Hymenobacter rubidus]